MLYHRPLNDILKVLQFKPAKGKSFADIVQRLWGSLEKDGKTALGCPMQTLKGKLHAPSSEFWRVLATPTIGTTIFIYRLVKWAFYAQFHGGTKSSDVKMASRMLLGALLGIVGPGTWVLDFF